MKPPLCIDLYAGLGGWTEGFLAEGFDCVGFDITQHVYGAARYPGQLVLQDVLTLHGSQFAGAACIVASPPCQIYSYMAMPWSRGKAMAAEIRQSTARLLELNRLFWACLDIQEQASRAAGYRIPLVIENVRGAQPWVGRAKANFGSFYLWGDVESVGGRVVVRPEFGAGIAAARGGKNCGGSWFNVAHNTESGVGQNPVSGVKVPGMNWSDRSRPAQGFNMEVIRREGVKQGGGPEWFDAATKALAQTRGLQNFDRNGPRVSGAGCNRKAASAIIAKIPFELARYIASAYRPRQQRRA